MTGEDAVRREVFALAYHLKWSWRDVLDLPITERREYLRLLADQLESERAAAGQGATP